MEDQRIADQTNGGFIRQPAKKQSKTRPFRRRMQVSTTGWQLDMADEASSINAMNLDVELVKGEYSLKDAAVTQAKLAKSNDIHSDNIGFGMTYVLSD